MEALILEQDWNMPTQAMASSLRTTHRCLWRVVRHYIEAPLERIDAAPKRTACVDETSVRKRHDYVTQFFDLDQRRLLDVQDGLGPELRRRGTEITEITEPSD